MSYTIIIRPPARKFLEKLRERRLYSRLREAIDGLANNPRPVGSTKLSGTDDLHRVRIGDYRVLYQFPSIRARCFLLRPNATVIQTAMRAASQTSEFVQNRGPSNCARVRPGAVAR